jgi:hypothetical protein
MHLFLKPSNTFGASEDFKMKEIFYSHSSISNQGIFAKYGTF